jgi:hypothetical protein
MMGHFDGRESMMLVPTDACLLGYVVVAGLNPGGAQRACGVRDAN